MPVVKKLSPEKLEQVSIILKAAAHPVRLGIIDLLDKKGAMSVNEICAELNADQSLVSHNLKHMKLHGILSSERNGQQVFYSLHLTEVVEIIRCLEKCDRF